MSGFRPAAGALAALLLAACQPPLAKVEGWRPLTGAEVKALADARTARTRPCRRRSSGPAQTSTATA